MFLRPFLTPACVLVSTFYLFYFRRIKLLFPVDIFSFIAIIYELLYYNKLLI